MKPKQLEFEQLVMAEPWGKEKPQQKKKFFNELNTMPTWFIGQYHNDHVTQSVVKRCADLDKTKEETILEVLRAVCEDRDALRKQMLGAALLSIKPIEVKWSGEAEEFRKKGLK